VDAWLVVKVSDPSYVFKWRQQAEQAMKDSGKPGMSDDQVKPFKMPLHPKPFKMPLHPISLLAVAF